MGRGYFQDVVVSSFAIPFLDTYHQSIMNVDLSENYGGRHNKLLNGAAQPRLLPLISHILYPCHCKCS